MKREYFEIWFRLTLIVLVIIAFIISFSRCTTIKTVTTHTRDTLFVAIHDTAKVSLKDSSGPEKVNATIDTVFKEIEKDCPNEEPKIGGFKSKIKKDCTIESITGGGVLVYFPKFKSNVKITFKGNVGTAVDIGVKEVINDKTTVIKTIKKSIFGRIMEDIQIFIVIICAFLIGMIVMKMLNFFHIL